MEKVLVVKRAAVETGRRWVLCLGETEYCYSDNRRFLIDIAWETYQEMVATEGGK